MNRGPLLHQRLDLGRRWLHTARNWSLSRSGRKQTNKKAPPFCCCYHIHQFYPYSPGLSTLRGLVGINCKSIEAVDKSAPSKPPSAIAPLNPFIRYFWVTTPVDVSSAQSTLAAVEQARPAGDGVEPGRSAQRVVSVLPSWAALFAPERSPRGSRSVSVAARPVPRVRVPGALSVFY